MKGKFIDVGDAKIYYELLKKNKMIVYLHGNSCNLTVFDYYMKHFKKLGYGFLAIDQRGEGKSTKLSNEEDYELDKYVSDVEKIMKKEKIKKAVFIGNSMGGVVSQAFALQHPKKVSGLILTSTSYHIKETLPLGIRTLLLIEPVIWVGLIAYFRFKNRNKKPRPYVDFSQKKYRTMHPFAILGDITYNCTKDYVKARMAQRNPIRNWNTKELLKKIKAPTLIVHGDSDSLIAPEAAFTFYKLLPNAQPPIMIPNTDHDVIIKEPELIAEFIEDFLRNIKL